MEPILVNGNQKLSTGATSLFFIQIFSTLAYSVLYVSLVLFSVQALHLSADQANHIMATFVAFNFAFHLVGGFFGGRLISFRALFFVGMILQTIGCLLIAQLNMHSFMLGMAIFLVGSGMDLPCINCMIAQLYQPSDNRREYAFLWNYSGMNIGFFIGITIAGLYQVKQDFNSLFIFASITNVIAMILVLFHWKKLKDIGTQLTQPGVSRIKRGIIGIIAIALFVIAMQIILTHALFTSEIILMLGILMACVVLYLVFTQKDKAEKNKLFAYCIFVIASLVFYTLYELIPMALTLFLERNVNREMHHFIIPTAWFLNINTAIIIFGCPLLAYVTQKLRKKGVEINIPLFFSIGLVLIGLAILVLPIGIYYANHHGLTAIEWPAITYTLLALAEISLSPIGYALVGELAPPSLRGVLMGAWLLTSGVAAILSNLFSNIALGPTQSVSPLISNASYSHTFLVLGIAGVVTGFILFLIKPLLVRLMKFRVIS
jgi:POT family proton-dependent oligopeptide transporter